MLCAVLLFRSCPHQPHLLQVPLDLGSKGANLLLQLWQGPNVALFEFPDPTGELLRETINLALHAVADGREPLVIHHQGLDLGLGELGILAKDCLI